VGERTAVAQGAAWPVRVDLQLEEGLGEQDVDRWVRSACVLCSHGCGLDVADRLVRPLVRRDGELVETDWDTALGTVAERSRRLLAEQGPLAMAFYTSGQLHLMAGEAEINWWMVRQGAMAARDTELAELFETCHEETWNRLKWIKTKVKEASAQVLVGG
jgi:anaerobic selenocysteine-containing dehydrogenase